MKLLEAKKLHCHILGFLCFKQCPKVNSNSIQVEQLRCILCYLVVGFVGVKKVSSTTNPWMEF
jgi:hypothetical protein